MQKLISLVALVLLLGSNSIINAADKANDDFDADAVGEEKCYCIAFAGQNDGKNPDKSNLPDKSTDDNDCNYWKYVPAGTCVEIGGSLIAGQTPAKIK